MNLSKILFVINPVSGGRDKKRLHDFIVHSCTKAGIIFKIYETNGIFDEKELKNIITAFQPDAVVAAGGDGTINLVGNLVINTETPMGIIPQGSANGLAKELGIPADIQSAFHNLFSGSVRVIDTLIINEKNVFHLADIGFNARIIRLFSGSRIRGIFMYALLCVREFFSYRSSRYEVITPSEAFKGKAFMIVAGNCKSFGTNLSINPEGKMDDGWFEISILKEFPKIKTFKVLYRLFNNTIYESPHHYIIKTKEAVIKCSRRRTINIDGEAWKGETLNLSINPKSLKVITGTE